MNKHSLFYFNAILFLLFFSLSQNVLGKENLLIFGDSLSSGYGIGIEKSWTKLLSKKIKDNNSSINIINRSIAGETTAGGLRRLPKLLKITEPKIVILELGANDALRGLPLDRTKQNLSLMIDESKKINSKVLLVGLRIPPNYGKAYSTKFYDLFGEIADEKEISLLPFMFDGFGADKSFFLEDQIHPNEKAQTIIFKNIWEMLEPMLK